MYKLNSNFLSSLSSRILHMRKYLSLCRSTLVERMPVLDEATFVGRKAGSLSDTASIPARPSVNLPNGVSKPSASPLVDLLDLSSDDVPPPSSSGSDILQDLLGVDLSPAPQQSGTFKCFIFELWLDNTLRGYNLYQLVLSCELQV